MKRCCFTLLLTLLAHTTLFAETTIQDKRKVQVLTPDLAQQKTRKIRLDNGLEAYLVSDPRTDKSGAMLTVKTGTWEDPQEHSGMAHFLEHMLFLGNKAYPKEEEFKGYITDHGGQVNAFTMNNRTGFIFTVDNLDIAGALDRFSHFFKDPLFNPSGVSRELNAIDQEYAKNIEDDGVRQLYVMKALDVASHPDHSFGMGNSKALKDVKQDELKKWYKEHYSANLMRLMVVSTLPLDEIQKMVVEDFSGIPNTDRQAFSSADRIFSPSTEGKFIYVEPVKDIKRLTLMWEMPASFADMLDAQPDDILCYVIGHEGEESLLAQLKRESLATSISCGAYRVGPQNLVLNLAIGLTDNGLQHLDTVILRCFETIAGLRSTGISDNLFHEVQRTQTIKFQYQQRGDLFNSLMTHAMQIDEEPIETYPEYTQIVQKFDKEAIRNFLSWLTPQNTRFYVMAPSSKTKVAFDQKEQWLGVPFAIKPISAELMQQWAKAEQNPHISLPAMNPFLPQDLKLFTTTVPAADSLLPHTTLIVDNSLASIYMAQDDRFHTPEIDWILTFKTPAVAMGNAVSVAQGDLYVKALKDALTPFSYPALMGGLNFDVKRDENGIRLEISGYSDAAQILLKEILALMMKNDLNFKNFDVYKDSLLREYANTYRDKPWVQGIEILKSILNKNFSSDKEKASALKKMTVDEFKAYSKEIFSTVFIEGMIYGNIDPEIAKNVTDEVTKALSSSKPYAKEQRIKKELINLPGNKGPFIVESKIKSQGNAAILAVESLPFSFENYAAMQILGQALDTAFFNELRTKQQTGYLVFSTADEIVNHLFLLFGDQSNTHFPRDLLARFELFLESFLQEFDNNLSAERFEQIRAASIVDVETAAKNIDEMGTLLNKLAFDYKGDFNWQDKRIEALKKLTYADFVKLAKEMIGKTNKRRVGVLLKGVIPPLTSIDYVRLKSVNELRSMSTFD